MTGSAVRKIASVLLAGFGVGLVVGETGSSIDLIAFSIELAPARALDAR